ncbi:MAG: SWIM zinc finger domain-containing protein [Thermoflexales bacterium]|nr:SWIM zinc finger domain-containing protein [Thermoflexales bacterium]
MTDLPRLTEDRIRKRATPQSWERGWDYFSGGAVLRAVWRDGVLTAEVEGSQYEPYQVTVEFTPDGEIESAECTCPYDWGGDCKHIIATLLYLIHRPEEIEKRSPLADLLSGLSREQLVELVRTLARIHPEIVEDVEDFVGAPTPPPAAVALSPTPAPPPSVDLAALQRQIRADLRAKGQGLYEMYYGDYYEGDIALGEVLRPAMERVRELLDAGDARSALAVLEAATIAWLEGCRRLDQDLLEEWEPDWDEDLNEFGQFWAEALLSADLTRAERAHWEERLDDWADTMPGGQALEVAVAAVVQGWDYPPLVAVLQGHITEKGAWEDEVPDFADDLALIRLRILERQGRFEEYLNLAEAEGQFLLYLQMLIRLGRSNQAFAEARECLTEPEGIHIVAQALAGHKQIDLALDLAAHGLMLQSARGRAALAEWLRDQAWAHGRTDLALQAAWQAFRDRTRLENYRWLREHLGKEWPSRQAEALQIVASSTDPQGAVDIYLYERMYREAIALADQHPWEVNVDRVIEAVKGEFPDWAFGKCRRRAEEIMDAGKAGEYDVAIRWLRRGRDILLDAGRQTQWDAYLRSLLEKHQRKYKLVPMLKTLM